jgi:hypothetical protein
MQVVRSFAFLLALVAPGCVAEAVKDQAARTAAAQHGYDRLLKASTGEGPAVDGVAVVTTKDLAKTPKNVRALLENLTRSFYKNGNAWLAIDHAANGDGPAPAPLVPPTLLVPPGGP